MVQGRVAESLQWVQEMLDTAEASGNADLLIAGHMIGCFGYSWAGEFTQARDHARSIFDIYDAERHRHLADILNQDPETVARMWDSICTWILGYCDQALQLEQEKDAQVRRRGHPFNLGAALCMGPHWWDRRLGYLDLRKRAEEIEQVGRENNLSFLSDILARLKYAEADLRTSDVGAAIPALRDALTALEAAMGKNGQTHGRSLLADAALRTGDVDYALRLLDEAIEQIERPGWGERLYYAEILRLKGWALSLNGDLEGAERNFLASLTWARRQHAKSWELRTSMSLARLWQSQGKRQDAYELLAPVYDWFTEGFDTKDLQEAKSLLAELR
jgi:tetratricopeptide (TPR) repeat protein